MSIVNNIIKEVKIPILVLLVPYFQLSKFSPYTLNKSQIVNISVYLLQST